MINIARLGADALGRVTTYAYTPSEAGADPYISTLVTYSDGATMREDFFLDGSPYEVSGTAVTPSSYGEGVDANGDTWTLSSTDNGADWTKSYTDTLGQQYMTQKSGPGGAVETVGRPREGSAFSFCGAG